MGSLALMAFLCRDVSADLLSAACERLGVRVASWGSTRRYLTSAGSRNSWLLLVGYLMAWLPFAMVERVAFLYHYFPAFLLTVYGCALALDAAADALPRPAEPRAAALGLPALFPTPCRRHRGQLTSCLSGCASFCLRRCPARPAVVALLTLLMLGSSTYFLPLYVGWPMEQAEAARRVHLLDTRTLARAPIDYALSLAASGGGSEGGLSEETKLKWRRQLVLHNHGLGQGRIVEGRGQELHDLLHSHREEHATVHEQHLLDHAHLASLGAR